MFREFPSTLDDRETLQDGLSATFRCPIAICRDSARLVSVICKLEQVFDTAIYWGFFHELAFEIEILSLDGTKESLTTQNRKIALQYIPDSIRSFVVEIVADGYESLIRIIEPRIIYRVTKTPASVAKAISKHDVLTRRIETLGYAISEAGTDRFARGFWLMERQDG